MIDLDRGVTVRFHPSGIRVHMYKPEPGVFLDVYGNPLPEKVAQEAGFDVAALAKAKLRNAKIAEARSRIDRELQDLDKPEAKSQDFKYRITAAANGRFMVFGPPNGHMLKNVASKEEAEQFIEEVQHGTQTQTRLQPLKDEGAS